MPIIVDCQCGKKLKVKDELVGKKIKCPGCGNVLSTQQKNAATKAPAATSSVGSIGFLFVVLVIIGGAWARSGKDKPRTTPNYTFTSPSTPSSNSTFTSSSEQKPIPSPTPPSAPKPAPAVPRDTLTVTANDVFINCECGIKLNIPPDTYSNSASCPDCNRKITNKQIASAVASSFRNNIASKETDNKEEVFKERRMVLEQCLNDWIKNRETTIADFMFIEKAEYKLESFTITKATNNSNTKSMFVANCRLKHKLVGGKEVKTYTFAVIELIKGDYKIYGRTGVWQDW